MRPLSIRARLSLWYCGVMAATLALFALIAFNAMRRSMVAAVDEELRDRIAGFQALLSNRAADDDDFLQVLLEHSGGGDLIQVADMSGDWVYRSPAVLPLRLTMPPVRTAEFRSYSTTSSGVPYRIVSGGIRVRSKEYRVQFAESLARSEATLRRLESFFFVSIPVLLLVSTVGGYWLSTRALAPVDEITRRARAISETNLDVRLPVPPARDELRRLAETLNAMLDRIQQAFQRITRFTADASHELRAPLTLIRAAAEVSIRHPRSEVEYREALRDIVDEADRTGKLVENLLTLARADAGAQTILRERLDLGSVAQEACRAAQLSAKSKGVALTAGFDQQPLWVEGDPDSLRRLLTIVIDNAVKYTPAGGRVSVKLAAADAAAVVTVTDTGVGIGPEDLPHIFERFYRADKARSRAEGGAGLGLSIAEWIAAAHGATISCHSNLGAGSTFEIRFPLAGTTEADVRFASDSELRNR